MDWYRRSLVPKLITVLAIFIMALSTFFITREYQSERSAYMFLLQEKQHLLAKMEFKDLLGAMRQASQMLLSHKADEPVKNDLLNLLRYRLNGIAQDDVLNAFLLIPEAKPTEGKEQKFRILAGNDAFEKEDKASNKSFPLNEQLLQAYQVALTDKVGMTEEFDVHDPDMTLITGMVPLRDEFGNMLALFVIDYDYTTVKAQLIDYLIDAIVISLTLGLIVIVVVGWYIHRKLRGLNVIHKLSEQAAQGDLSITLSVKGNDEVGRLAAVFNQMIERLSELLREVQQASRNVATASNELQRGAEETASSAQEVSAAMSEVAHGASVQMQSTEETQRAMQEIAVGVQQIAASSVQVSDWMKQSSRQAEDGRVVVVHTVDQMKAIRAASDDTNEALSGLSEGMKQISEAVHFIQGVVKQTELLSLNASIEAARAGEHGRGFQVVATEVRKLAEHSKLSLVKITDLIVGVQAQRSITEAAAQRQQEAVSRGLKAVQDVDGAFLVIADALQRTTEQVHESTTVSKEIADACGQVSSLLEQLSDISMRSNEYTLQVASTTEQQSALTEEMAASADSLLSLSKDLDNQLSKFKLES
ncbi:methyl-accepting chemotaxis protein [Paenibacillus sp. 481]|uniref:methyl-accepting chemotaxis protein n=1 Tax=Paenibacillus sp. 481 TaxID=2835869 RepID=UPI001E45356E|nr:methyl-accepting chemotaxis protein [Paenibacillus sp. 481]UHA74265.1 methyl-accepting chemotaxis protein [Paenibacillus sp. 481]